MKLEVAIRCIREDFKFKLNHSDISIIINIVTAVEEGAKDTLKDELIRKIKKAINDK